VENNAASCCVGSILAYDEYETLPLLPKPAAAVEYGELDGLSRFRCGAKSYAAGEYAHASGGAVAVVGDANGFKVLLSDVKEPRSVKENVLEAEHSGSLIKYRILRTAQK